MSLRVRPGFALDLEGGINKSLGNFSRSSDPIRFHKRSGYTHQIG
jgi:hypothetical protein